jgi:hypothetical protein
VKQCVQLSSQNLTLRLRSGFLLYILLFGLVTVAGCELVTEPEPTAPETEAPKWEIPEVSSAMLVGGPTCSNIPGCALALVGGKEGCVCELEGLHVSAAGGLPPPPAPGWPPLPGWTWPEPGVYEGGGYPPPPSGSPCDPFALDSGCGWTATVSCQHGVLRGTPATCTFNIDPADALDRIDGWTFKGDAGNNVTSTFSGSQWVGTAVESGEVTVHFIAGGSEARAVTTLGVVARTWSWDGSKRSFSKGVSGDLDNCQFTGAGLTADVYGCTATDARILINPGPGQGFRISQGSGPNEGLWYVRNPTTRMDLRTQLAKKYRSDATKYPVNGDTTVVNGCLIAYSLNPVPYQNNRGINTNCFNVPDFTALTTSTWSHEAQHLALAQPEAELPANDIYALWEPMVRSDSSTAFGRANYLQHDAVQRVRSAAAASHTGVITPFQFWYHTGSGIWLWSTVYTEN